jgi:acid phosphatase (class A)
MTIRLAGEFLQKPMMRKKLPAPTLILLLGLAACASSAAALDSAAPHVFYLDPSRVDLVHILAPPPAPDSPAGKADLQAVIDAQHARTAEQAAGALADGQLSVFRFADVMGSGFKPANLPFTAVFFERVASDDMQAIRGAKAYFNRSRPFVADAAEVKPIVHEPASASYPSGLATFAYADAMILAYMVPEKAAAIFDRAGLFAHNRVVAGVHYPSDVEAGRICASVIDNVLLHDAHFMADFARARSELRRARKMAGRIDTPAIE